MKIKLKIYGLLFCSIWLGCRYLSGQPEIHLVPLNYEGPLLVLFEQKGFPKLPIIGDTILYDFRHGNIIRTSDIFINTALPLKDVNYFYVDSVGKRTRLALVMDAKENLLDDNAYFYYYLTQNRERSVISVISKPINKMTNLGKLTNLVDSLLVIK